MKYSITTFLLALLLIGCSKEELFTEESRHDLWLIHEGAKLPIVVEGNTLSKVFVILLHGGPGGTAQEFNASTKAFSNALEDDYAMVYYDQRNSGVALGGWDEDKLTIEQHVEDLEKVIDLLQHRFGDEIRLFLAGHSWGGYLGTSFLLNLENQSKINAWININGLIHRNRNMNQVLDRIDAVGAERIAEGLNATEWMDILNKVQEERGKSITQYDTTTEGEVFDLIRLAEAQTDRDMVLDNNTNSPFYSIYSDNYDPLRIIINGNRDEQLINQMYDEFDPMIAINLSNIAVPSLSIYGLFDFRTPLQQGAYFIDKISSMPADKELVVLNKSGHSSMGNEPILLADEIKRWIEKYR